MGAALRVVYGKRLFRALFVTELLAVYALRSAERSPAAALAESIFWGALIAASLYAGWRFAQGKLAQAETLKNIPAIVGVALFFPAFIFGNMVSGLLMMGIWLLLSMNITLGDRRSLGYALTGSFMLFLYAVSEIKSSGFFIVAFAFVFAFVAVLVQEYYAHRVARQTGGVRMPFYGLGLDVSLAVLTVSALLYLFVPRPAPVNFGFLPAGGGTYYKDKRWENEAKNAKGKAGAESAGTAQGRAPGKEGRATGDTYPVEGENGQIGNEIVLYVRGPRPTYLRGNVYDRFDGLRWHRSDGGRQKLKLDGSHIVFGKPGTGASDRFTVIHTEFTPRSRIIYVPPATTALDFPGSVIARDRYGTLFAPKAIGDKSFYSAQTAAAQLESRPVVQASRRPGGDYLQLPEGLGPRVRELAHTVTAKAPDAYAEAKALETYLRTEYGYSWETVFHSQHKIPLEHFLFEKPLGHCEYFATAMTIMLRTLEIPARLVTGYSATTYNPLTGYYEVRPLDGHAWVEAWIAPYGWGTFEPTPAYAIPKKSGDMTTSKMIEHYLQKLTMHTSEEQSLLHRLEEYLYRFFVYLNKGIASFFDTVWRFLPYLIAVLLLAGTAFFLWKRYAPLYRLWSAAKRLERIRKLPDRQFITALFALMEHYLKHEGLGREAGWTVQEYAEALQAHQADRFEDFTSIASNFSTIRYGNAVPASFDKNRLYEAAYRVLYFDRMTDRLTR
jgi:protein-glutamine gamma-glutamyltransferase